MTSLRSHPQPATALPVKANLLPQRRTSRALRRFLRHRLALLGSIILLLMLLMAVFADSITAFDYDQRNRDYRDGPPNDLHPLGTDRLGLDVWSNLVYATRVSLAVGILTGLIAVAIGTLVGLISGYAGGTVDGLLMRLVDVIIAFPTLVIVLAAVSLLGQGLGNIILVISLITWTGTARVVRAQVLSLKNWDFVIAARALGASSGRIIIRHILPNTLSSVLVAATLAIAGAILIEANLSFLGLGDLTQPSWGRMLNAAQSHTILRTRWWLWVPPGLAIALCTLSFNFLGDGLRDALDPHTKD
ncbi:MAG: ABC transporter permease [Aggregatilineales bacterium]